MAPSQELMDVAWGTQQLYAALEPFKYKWTEEKGKNLRWSFDLYRRTPCLRALVIFCFQLVFLGFTYGLIFVPDKSSALYKLLFNLVLFMVGGYLFAEIEQFRSTPGYWQSPWNYFDLVILLLYLVWLLNYCIRPHESIENAISLSIISGFILFRILSFSRIFKTYAKLVACVLEMMTDLMNFTLLYVTNIIVFTVIYRAGFFGLEQFQTFGAAALYLFGSSLGGFDFTIFASTDPDGNIFLSEGMQVLGEIVLIAYLVLSSVVLMNLLIALLSVTFNTNQEKQFQKYRALFADLVKEYYREDGDDWLPEPLCFVNIMFNMCTLLKGKGKLPKFIRQFYQIFIIGALDAIITMLIVVPYCWVLEVSILVSPKSWKAFTSDLDFLRFFWDGENYLDLGLLWVTILFIPSFLVFIVTSPLWYPFQFLKHRMGFLDSAEKLFPLFVYINTVALSPIWFPCVFIGLCINSLTGTKTWVESLKELFSSSGYERSTEEGHEESKDEPNKQIEMRAKNDDSRIDDSPIPDWLKEMREVLKAQYEKKYSAALDAKLGGIDDRLKNLEEKIELILNRFDSHK